MTISYNLKVGKPDTTQDSPSHTPGTRQGNSPAVKDPGFERVGNRLRVTARRSTGINAEARRPITPGAPDLSPA
jgi:hypothetical protein